MIRNSTRRSSPLPSITGRRSFRPALTRLNTRARWRATSAYVKSSALKGREFTSINRQNEHLRAWETNVADKRIHGTTRKQVDAHFQEHEKAALRPLPPDLFPCYQEGQRLVHRDSYIEVGRAYYQVPPEYIGRRLWVRWDGRMVRIFDDKMQPVVKHVRLEAGKFSQCLGARGASPRACHSR